MRIAIVADVHGNLTALEAVVADLRRQAPDLVLHGGDLATSGAHPALVIDRIRELGWAGVCGNTDEMLWSPEPLADLARRHPQMHAMWDAIDGIAAHARDALGDDRMEWLRQLPREIRRGSLALVQASPASLWAAPLPAASDGELETYGALGAPVAVYGHIHRAFVRPCGAHVVSGARDVSGARGVRGVRGVRVVANAGSVSLSHDGDP